MESVPEQFWGEHDAQLGALTHWMEGIGELPLGRDTNSDMWNKLSNPDIFDSPSAHRPQDSAARQLVGEKAHRREIDQSTYMITMAMSGELELNEELCLAFVQKARGSRVAVSRLERLKGYSEGHYRGLVGVAGDDGWARFSAYEGFFWEQASVLRSVYLLMYERHKEVGDNVGSGMSSGRAATAIRTTHTLFEKGLLVNLMKLLDRRLDELRLNALTRHLGFWQREHQSEACLLMAEILFLAVHDLQCTEIEAQHLIQLVNKLSNILVEFASGTVLSSSAAGYVLDQEPGGTGQTHAPVLWYKGAQLLLFRLQMTLAAMLEPKFESPFDRNTIYGQNATQSTGTVEAPLRALRPARNQLRWSTCLYEPTGASAPKWLSLPCQGFVELCLARLYQASVDEQQHTRDPSLGADASFVQVTPTSNPNPNTDQNTYPNLIEPSFMQDKMVRAIKCRALR